ncbi:hypothetical protein KI387_011437 [Taxus chinensis]|uniref:Uncharacterized protein n=1 Tax=Taxus chinensis TaxID=29808 RepID=A0AA38FPD3_TAXCH|nr:hypothetical protein KI387_011437 [Taxus chinensis]
MRASSCWPTPHVQHLPEGAHPEPNKAHRAHIATALLLRCADTTSSVADAPVTLQQVHEGTEEWCASATPLRIQARTRLVST